MKGARLGDDDECLLGHNTTSGVVTVAQYQRRQQRREQFNFVLGLACGAVIGLLVVMFLMLYPGGSILKDDNQLSPLPTSDVIQVHMNSVLMTVNLMESNAKETEAITDYSSPLYGSKSRINSRGKVSSNASCGVTEADRFDCWPEAYLANQPDCEARGCCWNPSLDANIPFCFYPTDFVGYAVTSSAPTDNGLTAKLALKTPSPYPNNVMQLQLDVTYVTQSVLRFKIFDPNNQRFEAPLNVTQYTTPPQDTDYAVAIQNSPFGIHVYRKSTGATLFDSRNLAPLLFADQYIQIATRLSTPNLYGLGEHQFGLNLGSGWRRLVLWTRDEGPDGGGNLYGYHPFFLNLEPTGNAHGVFLLSSNAIEVAIQPYGGQGSVTYRSLGGILDMYVFTGPSPVSVVEQYVSLIGRPFMPPFWSLGFHLCKYGYGSAKNLNDVIQRNRAAKIPYDVQWNDIDYMNAYKDWTYDANNTYKGLPDIVSDIHSHGQRYVMIIDPGISSTQKPGTYPPYDDGVAMDIFIKNATGQILVGKVWPGETAFPDFFHPKANDYWFKQMQSYKQIIDFDGIWIDMNEISNFVDGSTFGCTKNNLDKPPYTPPGINGRTLMSRTVCPSAKQYLSTNYNLHNMYGWSEMRATMGGLQKLLRKRSFVLSRSSSPGAGVYGAHWSGDNASGWSDMYFSIPGIMNFNMFGIPMMGAEVCGFMKNTTRELCIRWTQLGAFYPFMRNHADLNVRKPQDPASFDAEALGYMRDALETRYSLLPFMYTWFYLSHTTGTPVIRPLFMLFPDTASIDRQFMWGTSLLVSPILDEGSVRVDAYFPSGLWYDLYNGSLLATVPGESIVLDTPINTINAHIRGGSILPRLPPATTTTIMRTKPFFLQVAPDEQSLAQGLLFWDDGESLDSIQQRQYTLLNFTLNGNVLASNVLVGGYPGMKLDSVQVFNILVKPLAVVLNGQTPVSYSYDAGCKVLTVTSLNVDLLTPFNLRWNL